MRLARRAVLPGIALLLSACGPTVRPGDDASLDVTQTACARSDTCGTDSALPPVDVPPPDVAPGATWCSLGSDVPGARVPEGFCIREYARLGAPRVMALAPNGDLFVSSPSALTAGGAPPGNGQIVVISDDDRDGRGELRTFLDQQPTAHGLVFAGGYLYFTAGGEVERVTYTPGQRAATGTPESVAPFSGSSNWTHGLAATPMGSVYATESGGGGGFACDATPLTGAVSRVESDHTLSVYARGFRNPMYVRCHFRDEVCAAAELGEDQTTGAREKILIVRPDTSYGYPCCFTQSTHSPGYNPNYDCNAVAREDAQITLGDTPFGLDWERGAWPAPYQGALFVALHGSFYLSPGPGVNSRVVYSPADPVTHVPTGGWRDFVTGFGPLGVSQRRASDVVFAADGRLFVADDQAGRIFWVAPTTLRINP